MDIFYFKKVTSEQKKYLFNKFPQHEDWGDGSINVSVPTDEVDGFDEWCEDQIPPLVPELK